MKDWTRRWGLELIMLTALVVMILLITLTVWGVNTMRADALRQLGYETKVVNFNCYAKHQGRWVSCDTAVNNQVQVTN